MPLCNRIAHCERNNAPCLLIPRAQFGSRGPTSHSSARPRSWAVRSLMRFAERLALFSNRHAPEWRCSRASWRGGSARCVSLGLVAQGLLRKKTVPYGPHVATWPRFSTLGAFENHRATRLAPRHCAIYKAGVYCKRHVHTYTIRHECIRIVG